MKTFSFIALFCSAFAFAQQGPAYSGDYVNYTHIIKEDKISLQLPKGSVVKPDGKLLINGRGYSIETIDAIPLLDKNEETKQNANNEMRHIAAMSSFTALRTSDPKKQVEGNALSHRLKRTQDKELIDTFYGYKRDSEHEMIENLGGAKLVGDTIFVITMNEKIDPQSDEILQNEDMLFNILDSATLINPKPDKKAM